MILRGFLGLAVLAASLAISACEIAPGAPVLEGQKRPQEATSPVAHGKDAMPAVDSGAAAGPEGK